MVDIARGEGENIHTVETQLACLEVFALGSNSQTDNDAETGYYATRTALARAVSEAAKYIAEEGAPAIVRLITKIAVRFSIPCFRKIRHTINTHDRGGRWSRNQSYFHQSLSRHGPRAFDDKTFRAKYGAKVVQGEYERLGHKRAPHRIDS